LTDKSRWPDVHPRDDDDVDDYADNLDDDEPLYPGDIYHHVIYAVFLSHGLVEGVVDCTVYGVLRLDEAMNDDDLCLQRKTAKENIPRILKDRL
jgi:hypothetical protein